jgi:hypothetical protein
MIEIGRELGMATLIESARGEITRIVKACVKGTQVMIGEIGIEIEIEAELRKET